MLSIVTIGNQFSGSPRGRASGIGANGMPGSASGGVIVARPPGGSDTGSVGDGLVCVMFARTVNCLCFTSIDGSRAATRRIVSAPPIAGYDFKIVARARLHARSISVTV